MPDLILSPVASKNCTACKSAKSLFDFHKSPGGSYGRASVCAACTRAADKAGRRLANPDYYQYKVDLESGIRRCCKCRERLHLSSFYTKTGSRCKSCESKAGAAQRLSENPLLAARREAESRGEIHCKKCGVSKPATDEFFYFHAGKAKAPCKECKRIVGKARSLEISKQRQARAASMPTITSKACSCCNISLPATNEYFHKKLSKLTSQCKKCKNTADRLQRLDWGIAKREKVAARYSIYKKARMQSDPLFALQERIRALLVIKMRQNGYTKKSKTHEILGCSWDFFKSHIERQFIKGMTWEKMGREIHIDHITPISTANTEEEVVALNHFTNLRPMWAKDNLSKGAQITHLI